MRGAYVAEILLVLSATAVTVVLAFPTAPFGCRPFSKTKRSSSLGASIPTRISLEDFLENQDGMHAELNQALVAISQACAEISQELAVLPLQDIDCGGGSFNVQGETQKEMDIVSNQLLVQKLNPVIAALASEEEEEIVRGKGSHFEVAFDPLDGSSNLDVNIPTGTIFGIAPHTPDAPFTSTGRSFVAAGYALYSACTELVLALQINIKASNSNSTPAVLVVGFALKDGTFYLARDNLSCPSWGPYYSLNEAREPDWPEGLRQWIQDAKQGRLEHADGTKYSSRYVCSLCADVHRTLLKGGWAGNPRPHLRLLYEAAPMAWIAEAAGGKGSDGVHNILDIVPQTLHDRVCVFVGSRLDVESLEKCGDVRQGSKKYKN